MENMEKNVRVSMTKGKGNQYDVYLEFSGQKEYLMSRRPNPLMLSLLQGGISVSEIERATKRATTCASKAGNQFRRRRKSKYIKRQARSFDESMNHLLLVIGDYLDERRYYASVEAEFAEV